MTIRGVTLFVSDLGIASDHGLREAAALAERAQVELVVCHVLPEVVGIRPLFPQLHVFDREEAWRIRDWAAGVLAEQMDRVLGTERTKPAVRVESGSTPATVLELSEELGAGLIVVGGEGSRGESGPAAIVERIARHARCPVLLSMGTRGKAVLAATDFSNPSLPAVHAAKEEAARLGLPLYVLHSVDMTMTMVTTPEFAFGSYMSTVIDARREEARGLLEELSKQLDGGLVLLREGPAIDATLDAAESVDAALVVVGTHGRTGLTRLTLGSVAEGVLRRARRSTLVVPLHPERSEG